MTESQPAAEYKAPLFPHRQNRKATLPKETLSDREGDIIVLMARGCSNTELAGMLCLSEKTVKNHISRIFQKLHVTSRVAAVTEAHRRDIIDIKQTTKFDAKELTRGKPLEPNL